MIHLLDEKARKLRLQNRVFVQNGVATDYISVRLEDGGAFDGCDTVLLTMTRDDMRPVAVRLGDGPVEVPASLMESTGALRFSLTGYVGDDVRATTVLMKPLDCGVVVASGTVSGGEVPPEDAAPDLWKQLMDEVGAATEGAEETLERAEGAASAASAAAGQAQSAQTAAETAASTATRAASDAQDAASQAHQSATAAADSAASVADKFITSAQATTLEPGSQATASVEDQVLTIGVPKGEKGDTPTVGIGTVETLPAGSSATATATSTATGVNINLGIPKGDKGDPGEVSAVQTAEGSDLSVSMAEGTVTIDDSALRERIAELEQQAQNVVTGTSTDLVAHGEDAYAQKPIEVRVKGKTWVNRWPMISGTNNGVTVATDETGLVTVTGTATADADVTADVSGWAAGKSYTTMVSATPTGCSAYFEVQKPSGNTSINATTAGATLNVASDATNCVAGVRVTGGTTVNTSFRIMLVDGTEAPDCFTPPASIASVQAGNLVTCGKNLATATSAELIVSGVRNKIISGPLVPGTYTFSANVTNPVALSLSNGTVSQIYLSAIVTDDATFTVPAAGNGLMLSVYVQQGAQDSSVTNIQLELGSTATSYEPPTVTETPLPEVELRSLPNGTCDELVIKADGTCEVERNVTEYEVQGTEAFRVGEHSNGQKYASIANIASSSSMLSDRYVCGQYGITDKYAYIPNAKDLVINDSRFTDADTVKSILASEKPKFVFEATQTEEPQSPVTLPALPAPTFNVYSDADIPSETSVKYARDINLVLENLEAVQAALLGGE